MNIAILSGKGGTGKTTVSTNLAITLNANYIDCDVEEPNGFLFLKPELETEESIKVEYPVINDNKCKACTNCVNICKFNALANVKDDIILFQKLCHGCGVCQIICKYNAITYNTREIGKIEKGISRGIKCSRGILNVGEPMAVPIIRQLLSNLSDEINLIDCPPGTSCNVVNTLKYVDSAILVTEPSEFGLHDLKMAMKLVKMYNIPFGIVINKDDGKNNIIKKFCSKGEIPLIGIIPYSKDTAMLCSKGKVLCDNFYHKEIFNKLAKSTKEVLSWN